MSEITILSDAEIDAVSGAWGTFNYTYNTMNFTINGGTQTQLRQSYWEISRKPLILRGETGEIPVFSEYVVPFIDVFLA